VTDGPFVIAWTAPSRQALSTLPEKVGTAVVELCYGPLADNPARLGKPLRFELEGSTARGSIDRSDRHHVEIVNLPFLKEGASSR
jgi:hypothetical protein